MTITPDWEQGIDWEALRLYRRKRLCEAMERHDLHAVLYTKLDTIRYTTSFRPIYSMWFHGTRYAALLTADGHLTFFVASGDVARVARTMPWVTDVVPFPFVFADGTPLIADAVRRLGLRGRIGVDLLPLGSLRRLEQMLPEVQFVDGQEAIEEARRIKHPIEVQMLRLAAEVVDLGMQAAIAAVRPGATEIEVSTAATSAMMLAGSEDIPYYPLVASGEHGWLGYRFPTTRRIRPGEMVRIDCGAAIVNGYNGDIARIAFAGEPTEEQRRVYRAVYEMLQTGIDRLRPGVLTTEVVEAVAEVARRWGYADHTYFGILGHGLGTDLHEAPTIGERVVGGRPPERLEPGMVVGLEPGVLLPGVGGGHLEDVVLVTEGVPEVLTKTPFLVEYL
ncbi:MAG: Xaa-Pro peptidase family protein [Armatimonadota bacterium]|nr:Xaa-Pro peptidase family protein [Armatimonadota bacterium]